MTAERDDLDGSWEAARLRKLTMALDVSHAARLAWLEDAIRFAHAAGALPRPRDADPAGADGRIRKKDP